MKVAPVLKARVLSATNSFDASTGATSTVALVLAPVLLAANTGVASTSATNN